MWASLVFMRAPEHAWERRADAVLGIAASAILFAMMTLTFVDVVARYVFNRPISGAFEVTELLLLVLIFAGLPLVSHADEHVTMEQVWLRAGRVSSYGDATDVLRIAYGPFVYFMAAMLALAGAIHLYKIFESR
jgi:TRAP-type C4-dicarboxylate transport system permease small subunit